MRRRFLKYITAVLSAKKAESDRARDRTQERSGLLKNLLLIPFNMGIPLIRDLLLGRKRPSA